MAESGASSATSDERRPTSASSLHPLLSTPTKLLSSSELHSCIALLNDELQRRPSHCRALPPKEAAAATNNMTLSNLPPDLQLLVAQHVLDRRDGAALCVAHPRLGLEAQRRLPQYQGPLFCVALRLLSAPDFAVDEPLLRRYAADAALTHEGCDWLRSVARKTGLCIVISPTDNGWLRRLSDGDKEKLVVEIHPGLKIVYEGEQGVERRVRAELPSGEALYFEGEKDAERKVRVELANGTVGHLEGEQGAERAVRAEWPNGAVTYLEGEKGLERKVRMERPDGVVVYYEGEKGAERWLRAEGRDGAVLHFEGEMGAERAVRVEGRDGTVVHFEGEKGVERKVRLDRPYGAVTHFEGEKGVERKVRVERPDGVVVYYEGEKGAERRVRAERPDGMAVQLRLEVESAHTLRVCLRVSTDI